LHYGTIMGSRACVKMAAAAWASGFLNALLHTANTFSIPLCQDNTVDQFFCEIPQILKLSCSDAYLREVGLLVVSVFLVFVCFVFIVVSYVQIFTVVLRIPSEQGRHKAFSMCLPHLAVVSLFLSTVMFAYLKPPSLSSPALDLVVSVLYSVVPPMSLHGEVNVQVGCHCSDREMVERVIREVPDDWEKADITPIFRKGKREGLGNNRLVSFTSDPGKVMEQILLETISKHMKEKGWKRQHGLSKRKWKPCLTNLAAF
ncbi:olfactory receptor 14A16-like, partial [Dromaius novaehollandiae]|uniref:olfactory receptor 14A16-like n=1 Tax=Dromaius novaehollandiae TaxID=8790 RepID=UPI00311FAD24